MSAEARTNQAWTHAPPPLAIAVIDSGANTPHPHLPEVAGGTHIHPDGPESTDFSDRLGHGTAVAAAIHEKAPDADIYAVKVFDRELATSLPVLVQAIDWASGRGLRVINLSLGTARPASAHRLLRAAERAAGAGSTIVSAKGDRDRPMYPGSLPGVIGVILDPDLPRDRVRVAKGPDGTVTVAASGLPRPIPGVPPSANLSGISFAVANVSGVLAAALHAIASGEGTDLPPEVEELLSLAHGGR